VAKQTLNRSNFLNAVAERTGAHRRDVEHVWENALAVIQDSVKKGVDVSITGFGKFKQRATKARKAGLARNPFTGEMVKVAAKPASKLPRFLPAKPFKEFVAGRGGAKPPVKATAPKALSVGGAAPAKSPAKKTAKKPAKRAAAARKTAKKPAKKKAAKRR